MVEQNKKQNQKNENNKMNVKKPEEKIVNTGKKIEKKKFENKKPEVKKIPEQKKEIKTEIAKTPTIEVAQPTSATTPTNPTITPETPVVKTETKPEAKKEEKKPQKKWDEATVCMKDAPISTKYARDVCSFIKGKNPDRAIDLLQDIIKQKKALPMKGECAHKKGLPKGRSGGKYPVKASEHFILGLKNLIANAKVKMMNTERLYIYLAKADKAPGYLRGTRISFGPKKFKRSHVLIGVKER